MKLGDNTPFTALQYIISSVTMIRAEHSFFITNISKNLFFWMFWLKLDRVTLTKK